MKSLQVKVNGIVLAIIIALAVVGVGFVANYIIEEVDYQTYPVYTENEETGMWEITSYARYDKVKTSFTNDETPQEVTEAQEKQLVGAAHKVGIYYLVSFVSEETIDKWNS